MIFFCNRPAVTELQNAAQLERVRKEKDVCFFLVTSSDNPELTEKLKVNLMIVITVRCKTSLFLIIYLEHMHSYFSLYVR